MLSYCSVCRQVLNCCSVCRQVLNGTPSPADLRIVHRILAGSDLTRRNSRGQTVLFEAMRERLPVAFLDALVRYGVDLSARDYLGRSPRDYAAALAREDLVHWVDGHVTGAVFRRNTDRVLDWIVRGYDHVMHVLQHATDERGRKLMDRLAEDQCMKTTAAAINTIPKVKVCGWLSGRVHRYVSYRDVGDTSWLFVLMWVQDDNRGVSGGCMGDDRGGGGDCVFNSVTMTMEIIDYRLYPWAY